MDLMKKSRTKARFLCLLRKPFAGVNGSGKHNNWSMNFDTGVNLLSPEKLKEQFTVFILYQYYKKLFMIIQIY